VSVTASAGPIHSECTVQQVL